MTTHPPTLVAASVAFLFGAIVVSAQAQVSAIDDTTAADLAYTISQEASSVDVPLPTGREDSPEKAMQHHVDELSRLAGDLDSEIRSGKGKAQTRALFRRLRAERLRALELAVYHDVALDPLDAALFEQSFAQLERYYSGD